MEILIKFLTIISWIGCIGGRLLFLLTSYLQIQYKGSLEEKLDRLKGVIPDYGPVIRFSFLMFVLSLAFLIAAK